MSVYVGKNVSVSITYLVEGDMGSFIAQEVTFEPKQTVEGIEALGSNTIQAWALGLKVYEVTLKEALKVGADGKKQLDRLQALNTDDMTNLTVKLIWDGGTGSKITVTLSGCIFTEISVGGPKNAPHYITSKLRGKTAAVTLA